MRGVGPAFAQATDARNRPALPDGRTQAGHTAPKRSRRPSAATGPDGQMTLGSVHIPKAVKADGKALAAGTYQVRLTPQTRDAGREGSDRRARALGRVREGRQGRGPRSRDDHPAVRDRQGSEGHAAARRTRSKVETLKGGDYVAALDQQGRQPLPGALAPA